MKTITTFSDNKRTSTQELLQQIYAAMLKGETEFKIDASGQHDIGGPLWNEQGLPLKFIVRNPGQRVGSMGMPGTEVIVEGSAPADVGWLNAGATVVVKGDGGDTTGYCAADGIIYIGGRVGTRSGSMMKHDPAFPPPQLWVLKNTGSFSFEFMGGGIAIVCGSDCENLASVIGDRPCVGMVGGTVYVRGPVGKLPANVRFVEALDEEDYNFLGAGLPKFLNAIERPDLLDEMIVFGDWHKIVAKTQAEIKQSTRLTIKEFRSSHWIGGGLFGDVVNDPGNVAPLVSTGLERVYSPVWNNSVFAPPCQYACPSGIPTQERINLLRKGKVRAALELVLQYSPFPASVCGAACPNPCMAACTRRHIDFSILAGPLGRYSVELPPPPVGPATGKKFAVIGAGVGGLSAAWQLVLRGHDVTVYERQSAVGGKMASSIPNDRLDKNVVQTEINRIIKVGVKIEYGKEITRQKFKELYEENDGLIIAVGAYNTRKFSFPGSEKLVPLLPFLNRANSSQAFVDMSGKSVVVIGAGDAGMDACYVSWKFGAKSVMAVDIREPASSSRERAAAVALGTQIIWPRTIIEYRDGQLFFKEGDPLQADIVIEATGNVPDIDWLPKNLARVKDNWLQVDEVGRTSDPKIFAVGDVSKPGTLTEAIGAGRIAALALHAQTMNEHFELSHKPVIPIERLKLIYFTPPIKHYPLDPLAEADRCISCGTCRDCNICVNICGQNAISRRDLVNEAFEFHVDEDRCIGCGFCAAACPSGIWTMVPNLQPVSENTLQHA